MRRHSIKGPIKYLFVQYPVIGPTLAQDQMGPITPGPKWTYTWKGTSWTVSSLEVLVLRLILLF